MAIRFDTDSDPASAEENAPGLVFAVCYARSNGMGDDGVVISGDEGRR
jgi:hypothetical protein